MRKLLKCLLIVFFITVLMMTFFIYEYWDDELMLRIKNLSVEGDIVLLNTLIKFSRGQPEPNPNTTMKDLLESKFHLQAKMTTINSTNSIEYQIQRHKEKLLSILEYYEANPSRVDDPYGVSNHRPPQRKSKYTVQDILCDFKNIPVRSLKSTDDAVRSFSNSMLYPETDFLSDKKFNTCALVSSSGSMYRSNLGKEIDSHDFVVRLNDAPTLGFEKDVGSKTNLRVANSYLINTLVGPEILHWKMFQNPDWLLFFDVPRYKQSLEQWFVRPIFYNFVDIYLQSRLNEKITDSYLLYPDLVWEQYRVMMKYTDHKLPYKPPSSGFMTFLILMNSCNSVDLYEFIPSLRMSGQCYYWKNRFMKDCSFRSEHPLVTEKKLYLLFNQFDDVTTFKKGVIRVPGFSQTQCPTRSEAPPPTSP